MKKKVVAACMTVALAAVAMGGATLAYFTDTDKAQNTMAVGNLDITVSEKNAAGEPFVETDYTVMPGEANKIDKQIWTTLETGSVDAYVRSIVLFEVNDNGADFFDQVWFTKHLPTESAWPVEYTNEPVTIDGVEYMVACFYPANFCEVDDDGKVTKRTANNGILKAGESYCSINQVWLDDEVTSEQVARLGENYNILTVSQAVQVAGNTAADNREALNNEFGEVNNENVGTWFSWVTGTAD